MRISVLIYSPTSFFIVFFLSVDFYLVSEAFPILLRVFWGPQKVLRCPSMGTQHSSVFPHENQLYVSVYISPPSVADMLPYGNQSCLGVEP